MAAGKRPASSKLYCAIMAGGKGTRFWPLSRETFPKQFLKIHGEKTLVQQTMQRLDGLVAPGNVSVVTTRDQKPIVEWQARELKRQVECIVEPVGRNTAPAIALVSFKIHKRSKDALLLVLPSDHFIGNDGQFAATVKKALPLARAGRLVTFGIKPSRPETGYGYIKAGGRAGGGFDVERFVEKPSAAAARKLLKEGSYYWNSGMFLFRAKDMIAEIKKYMPALYKALSAARESLDGPGEGEALSALYPELVDESIDYGVMEKSKKVSMVVAEFPWSDIGSWSSLGDVMAQDREGNVKVGKVMGMDCRDSIFFAGQRLIAAIGLKDAVVVDTADATLVASKDRVQDVKAIVAELKKCGKEEHLLPSIEERPWGWFSVLEQGPNHKIKHIYLKPKAKLSLQMHNHRSEHWIVVSGTARVQKGEEVLHVHKNESTFIPAATRHRLENPGLIPLRIIEIQSGDYLGEDDITRFDDIYGREKG